VVKSGGGSIGGGLEVAVQVSEVVSCWWRSRGGAVGELQVQMEVLRIFTTSNDYWLQRTLDGA
jgi:hypothetical protein